MKKDAGQIGVWGCRGSGKTTRQRELVEGRARIIVLDPMEQFRGFGRRCTNLKTVLHEIAAGWESGFKVVIPTGFDKAKCLEFIRHFVPVLFAVQQPYADNRRGMSEREITLVIDEADLFFPNKSAEADVQAAIDNLCRRGRHYGIETIAASQRLAQVSTTFRGNCTEHYFFAQSDHTDIQAATSILGPDYKKPLMGLKAHDYLHKSMSAGIAVEKGRNRSKFVKQ